MLGNLLGYLRDLLTLAEATDRNTEDIRDLRAELKELTAELHDLKLEIRGLREEQRHTHEKFALRLENAILRVTAGQSKGSQKLEQ